MTAADELDRTARQVRLDGRDDSPVHEVAATWSDPWVGMSYRTRCCHVMTKAEGADTHHARIDVRALLARCAVKACITCGQPTRRRWYDRPVGCAGVYARPGGAR